MNNEDKVLVDEAKCIMGKENPSEAEINTWNNGISGLALSGGGIRSASFCLGVIQALKKNKLLDEFDYLSTVSGGGYIGGALTWANDPTKTDDEKENFSINEDGNFHNFLKSNGNYLTPGGGVNLFSLVMVVIRGIALNLLVWIPFFSVVIYFIYFKELSVSSFGMPIDLDAYDLLLAILLTVYLTSQFSRIDVKKIAIYSFTMLSFFVVLALVSQKNVNMVSSLGINSHLTFEVHLLALLLASLILAFAVYSLKTYVKISSQNVAQLRYKNRRAFEVLSAQLIILIISIVIVISIPSIYEAMKDLFIVSGPVAMVIGIANGIISFSSKTKLTRFLPAIGAAAFLFGFIMVCYSIASEFLTPETLPFDKNPPIPCEYGAIALTLVGVLMILISLRINKVFWIYLGTLIFSIGLGLSCYMLSTEISSTLYFTILALLATVWSLLAFHVNLNYLSIHRYYRDRLMELFNPDARTVSKANNDEFSYEASPRANKSYLKNFVETGKMNKLYHLINTNVVLVDSKNRKLKSRGGDNFILSPIFCGSRSTGWKKTEHFLKGKLTLPTAVAISGAAANPNTGVGGVGITRNKAVSVLMSLLNLRLGYWVKNPGYSGRFTWLVKKLRFNHLTAIWKEISPLSGYHEDSAFIQLSDGGHFENLAVYELLRRKAKLIVACDVGEDKNYEFGDLRNAIERAKDFNANISFKSEDDSVGEGSNTDGECHIEKLIPQEAAEKQYPFEYPTSKKGYVTGEIAYMNSDGTSTQSKGVIIYIKATFLEKLDIQLRGYKQENPDYPHESTADQFFSEQQFEAYRKLGKKIGADACPEIQKNIFSNYNQNLEK